MKATQNHGQRWEDYIKMDLEVDWEAVDCINLFHRWDQRLCVMNRVVNFRIP